MMVSLENLLKRNNIPEFGFAVELFCCSCKKVTASVVMSPTNTSTPHNYPMRGIYCKICGSTGGCFYNGENSLVFPRQHGKDNLYLVYEDNMYNLSIHNSTNEPIASFSNIKELNVGILNYFILS